MACVAFDLDCTLGFFEITNPLVYLWSIEHIRNPEQARVNRQFKPSITLLNRLQRAKETFAKSLLADPAILSTVIRPNLDALMLPLLEAKKVNRLKTIIIYSNTGVSYSVELAKFLIESIYKTNVFSLEADHWHPLRTADHVNRMNGHYVEPYKTMETLQKLFKKALHKKKSIPIKNILFVDDRSPKHKLQENEAEGLTYIVPTHFNPVVTKKQKDYIMFLAVSALVSQGLTDNKEYLESGFCHRNIPYDFTKQESISGLPALLEYVRNEMDTSRGAPWVQDTAALSAQVRTFLSGVR